MNIIDSFLDFIDSIFPKAQPKDSDTIRALMASDMVQMKELANLRSSDLRTLRKYYNAIYCPLDLAIMVNGVGSGVARPYIGRGRTPISVTDLAVKNIKYIYNKGFRIMVVLGNEPSIRKNYSYLMGGLNFVSNIHPENLYTPAMLENEKKCWNDLYSKAGKYLFGVSLYLEPSMSSSMAFCKSLASHIRGTGFKGRLLTTGIGAGKWASGDAALGVHTASSIANISAWLSCNQQLKSADGMQGINSQSASTIIPQMMSTPGPDGWIMYIDEYRGSAAGPGKLQDWMYKYVGNA